MWLLPGWFKTKWWADVDSAHCTPDEIKSALDYSLAFQGNDELTNDHSRMLISNKVNFSSHKEYYFICILTECLRIPN